MNLTLDCGVFLFLKEIPPDLVCDINCDGANAFIKFLLEKQKWPEVLLLLTRKVSGEPPLGDCLIKDCNFSDLDLCTIIPQLSAWDQRRAQLLGRLIDLGGESAELARCSALRGFLQRAFRPLPVTGAFCSTLEAPLNSVSFSSSVSSHLETQRPVPGCCPVGTPHFCELLLPLLASLSLALSCEGPQVCGGGPWPCFSPPWSLPPDLWLDYFPSCICCVGPRQRGHILF